MIEPATFLFLGRSGHGLLVGLCGMGHHYAEFFLYQRLFDEPTRKRNRRCLIFAGKVESLFEVTHQELCFHQMLKNHPAFMLLSLVESLPYQMHTHS